MSFEDSDVVRSAVRVEGFRDDEFNYQLIRALGVADYGGSAVGECLAVVAEITDGSPQSWTRAFERLAQRVEEQGRTCLAAGGRVSGRDHLLRASTYYRTAEYYAGGGSGVDGPGARSQACFSAAAALLDPPVEPLGIPFAGGILPGYLVRPAADGPASGGGPRPTVVGRGRVRLERRGAVLPARRARRRAGMERRRLRRSRASSAACAPNRTMTFRPDYEVPLAAVLDAVAGLAGRGRRPAGALRPELRLVLRRPGGGHRSAGRCAGGQPAGGRHGPVHGGVGRVPTSTA